MRQRDALAAFNERIKLLAGFFNTLGLGFIGFAFIRLLVEGVFALSPDVILFTITGVVMHAAAHYLLGYLEKETNEDDE